MIQSGNTKGGSITVLQTSCLTGLDQSALQIKTKIVSSHTRDSKPVKQEFNGTVILPPLVFPDLAHAEPWECMFAVHVCVCVCVHVCVCMCLHVCVWVCVCMCVCVCVCVFTLISMFSLTRALPYISYFERQKLFFLYSKTF